MMRTDTSRRGIFVGLVAAVCLLTGSALTNGIQPRGERQSATADTVTKLSSKATQSRSAPIDARDLYGLAENAVDHPRFSVPLRDGLTASIEIRSAEIRRKNRFVIHGVVPGYEHSHATISVMNRHVSGYIGIPGVGDYTIFADGMDQYDVRKVDVASQFVRGRSSSTATEVSDAPAPEIPVAMAAQPITIRLYVLYTPAAAGASGGIAGIEANLAASVAQLNTALENSQTSVQFDLIRTDLVAVDEAMDYPGPNGDPPPDTILEDVLDDLEDTGAPFTTLDGVSIHDVRSIICADMVMMVVHFEDDEVDYPCGEGNVLQSPSTDFYDEAFSVVRDSCLPGFTFSRLLGQKMGCGADHFSHNNMGADGGTYPFSHGHRFSIPIGGGQEALIGTIMTQPPVDETILYFSNPSITVFGQPIGVPQGEPNAADNARTIDTNAPYFSNFGSMICADTDSHLVCHPNDADLACAGAFTSIQAAINAANDGDQIVVRQFASESYNERINLNGKAIYLRSEDPTDSTVVGNTVIDGDGLIGSVVMAQSGEGTDTIIHGFTIRNGSGAQNGGGVFINGSSPYIADCVIEDNEAAFSGAGIYINDGSPVILNTEIKGNEAGLRGGGIYMTSSSPTITGCTIEDNSAPLGGGGAYMLGSSPIVANTSFIENSSSTRGGAIFAQGGSPTLNNCIIDENQATFNGGGIFSQNSSISVNSSIIEDNSTNSRGGGAYLVGGSPTFTSTIFEGNEADHDASNTGEGGAMYVQNSPVWIIDCRIGVPDPVNQNPDLRNTAGKTGGGIFVFKEPGTPDEQVVLRPSIVGSLICGNLPNNIVGPWNDIAGNNTCPADVDIVVCEPGETDPPCDDAFDGGIQDAIDSAGDGDVIVIQPGEYFETIDFKGKAIHLRSADPTNPAATIINGSMGEGSVITAKSGEGEDTILEGFTITGGNSMHGGGMFIQNSGPTVRSNVFGGNETTSLGGGIANFNSSAIIQNCVFENNTAGTNGGGMYNQNSDALVVIDCTFQTNHANGSGGGMANQSSNHTMIELAFLNNTTTNLGGGMYNAESMPVIIDSYFEGNVAEDQGGGIMITANSQPAIADTTVCENDPTNIEGTWDDLGGNSAEEAAQCPQQNSSPFHSQLLAGPSGSITGSFDGATSDGVSSCDLEGVDVYFTYAVTDGPVDLSLNTCGSDADTSIAVFDKFYTELACESACDGGACDGVDACLTVPNLADGEYLIRVSRLPDGAAGASGPNEFVLNYDIAPAVPGDLNGDGLVNVLDLLILLENWGPCPANGICTGDLNGDGLVNVLDLLLLLENWG